MSRFDELWIAWPANGSKGYEDYTRKKDKKKCHDYWDKHKLDEKADTIIYDVTQRKKFDKGWLGQNGSFLCAPLVYLRNERWDDGEFADWRDDKKAPPVPRPIRPDGPKMSRYAIAANRIMFQLAYMDSRRGFRPLGNELRAFMLTRKAQLVADVEANPEDYVGNDFRDLVYDNLEKILNESQVS